MKYLYIFISVFFSFLLSCAKEELIESPSQCITASFSDASDARLKTTMAMHSNNSLYDYWTPGDKIAVSDGKTLSSFITYSEGEVRAQFYRLEDSPALSEVPGTTYLAYYPGEYCQAYLGDSSFRVSLPSVQYMEHGKTLAEESWPMIGVSSSFKMPFYNLCSIFRLGLYNPTELFIDSIIGTSTVINLSGPATASFVNGVPTLTMDPVVGSPRKVHLICNGERICNDTVYFYIAIPPHSSIARSLVFDIYTNCSVATKTITVDFTFLRSKYHTTYVNYPGFIGQDTTTVVLDLAD